MVIEAVFAEGLNGATGTVVGVDARGSVDEDARGSVDEETTGLVARI